MKNKWILFIEPLCKDKEHLSFNSDLITHLQKKHQISFCGGEQYYQNLEANIKDFSASYCFPYKESSVKELLKRYIFIWKTILKHTNTYPINIFSSFDNTLFSLFSIILYLFGGYKMRKETNILFIYNNLYSLENNILKRYLLRINIKLYHWKCIVLTENMKAIFQRLIKEKSNIYLYPHPYYAIDEINKKNVKSIKLLLVGRQADYAIKSSFLDKLIVEINKIIITNKLEKTIEIHIGTNNIVLPKANFPIYTYANLNNIEYNQLFNAALYIVFPLNYSDSFRASGVLMDAISFNTPIIAPKIGHFTEFLDCGFFYSNVDEISVILSEILNISSDEYQALQDHIIKKKNDYPHDVR